MSEVFTVSLWNVWKAISNILEYNDSTKTQKIFSSAKELLIQQDNANTTGWMTTQADGRMWEGSGKNPGPFGADPNLEADPGSVFIFFTSFNIYQHRTDFSASWWLVLMNMCSCMCIEI